VLNRVLRSRIIARLAVIALSVGLTTLAGLALWNTHSTHQAAARVRAINDIANAWAQVYLDLSVESEALNDYLRAGSDIGRTPLVSALGSAEPELQLLEKSDQPRDAAAAARLNDTYLSYTEILRQLLAAGSAGDWTRVLQLADEAGLGAASARKQVVADLTSDRLELADYLAQVDEMNRRLQLAAVAAFVVDLLLLVLCTVILLSHQRRVERQAVRSRYQALHDDLTGMGNRILLNERVNRAIADARRTGGFVGMLLLDLNRFKEVNDTLGHFYGDLLLREVAVRLSGAVSDGDTVVRLGGDEFAIVLPGRSGSQAMVVAEHLLDVLRRPADLGGVAVDVSASVGVAGYPVYSANGSELLQHADIAMYSAKRQRLGAAVYDPQTHQHRYDRLTILGELRQAIDRGELVLYYQPKVDAGTGGLRGVEALIRWQHPDRGLLTPAEFLSAAADTELIHPLTDHVLGTALAQHNLWRDQGLVVPLAVNIAAQRLLAGDFAGQVAARVAEHSIEPGHLTLEITENVLIADPDRVAGILTQLQQLGVRLSIDDFGTGYSSMAYLQKIPLNELKIDRCFVTSMESSRGDKAIVRAILQLAHELRLEVVAEGVEDEQTWFALRAMGCDVAQGHHLCPPLPADAVTEWMANRSGPEWRRDVVGAS
jgi:diguanylate cyclase (GGDEF)-like protein